MHTCSDEAEVHTVLVQPASTSNPGHGSCNNNSYLHSTFHNRQRIDETIHARAIKHTEIKLNESILKSYPCDPSYSGRS